MTVLRLIAPVVVVHRRRQDGRQIVFDINAELRRELRHVDTEDRSQLTKRIVEHPFRGSHVPRS